MSIRPSRAALLCVLGGCTLFTGEGKYPAPEPIAPPYRVRTQAEWKVMETQARATARPGGVNVAEFRLTTKDAPAICAKEPVSCVSKEIEVEPNACYTVGVAWGYQGKVSGDFLLTSESTGESVTDAFVRDGFKGEVSPASGAFCVDHAGTVGLQFSAVSNVNIMLDGELHEFAVAVTKRQETAADTEKRREEDAERAAASDREREANVLVSEARQYGVAFAKSCQRCRVQATQCRATDDTEPCRLQFETCAQAMGTDDRGRILCHP